MKKKIIVILLCAALLLVSGFIIYNSVCSNQKYDYKVFSQIPDGYVDYDEEEYAGKDYTYLGWYKYEKMPTLPKEYQLVNGNAQKVKKALNLYTGDVGSIGTADDDGVWIWEEEPDGYLAQKVSDDDFFILDSYKRQDGEIYDKNEMFTEEHYTLFYFDVQSLTLYRISVIR